MQRKGLDECEILLWSVRTVCRPWKQHSQNLKSAWKHTFDMNRGSVFVCLCVCARSHILVCMHRCICMHVHIHVCIPERAYTEMYTQTYIDRRTYQAYVHAEISQILRLVSGGFLGVPWAIACGFWGCLRSAGSVLGHKVASGDPQKTPRKGTLEHVGSFQPTVDEARYT